MASALPWVSQCTSSLLTPASAWHQEAHESYEADVVRAALVAIHPLPYQPLSSRCCLPLARLLTHISVLCCSSFAAQNPLTFNVLMRVAALTLVRACLEAFPSQLAVEPFMDRMHSYVRLFFTSLTVKPVIVVEAAHSALSQVRCRAVFCSCVVFNAHADSPA